MDIPKGLDTMQHMFLNQYFFDGEVYGLDLHDLVSRLNLSKYRAECGWTPKGSLVVHG